MPDKPNRPNLFECDPEKNTECSKKDCYINGGRCRFTSKETFKLDKSIKGKLRRKEIPVPIPVQPKPGKVKNDDK